MSPYARTQPSQMKDVNRGPRQARNLIDYGADADATAEWADIPSEAKPELFQHLVYGLYLKIYLFNDHRFYNIRWYWRAF